MSESANRQIGKSEDDASNTQYASRITHHLTRLYHTHTDFILLLILFITFRVLALVAYRPGGLVLDFSDFYWYRSFAELSHQGYYPYDNLWTTYPPLFPIILFALYYVSSLLPPWEHANLWFTLLLGGFFLLFEIGNFILLYLFAQKIANEQRGKGTGGAIRNTQPAIRSTWIYAAFFVPVYTLTGWFESYPLFFFLLSLYLLLKKRPYLSAFFTGIGFLIKLIPLILMPVAVQIFSKKRYALSLSNGKPNVKQIDNSQLAIRHSQFTLPFDVPRTAIYVVIFLVTVIVIALPFYRMNPDLALGSQQITGARRPWETVWALIDGNYEYGIIPLDMRNLDWTPGDAPPTRILWPAVTVIFGLVYAWFYTRPLNWQKPRSSLAFVGFTLCLFMLWSKGYSPQWLGWILFFIALLLPNIRGVTYAVILSIANIIEANFFFIMFPEDHWLLAATVLMRTFLFAALAVEFLWLIRPPSKPVQKARAWGLAVFVALLLAGIIPAGMALGRSYFDLRLRQSPYSATINRLQGEPVTGALLLNSHPVYNWFYPYLRRDYTLFMLDDYAPASDSVERRTTTLLNSIAGQTDVLWIYDADAAGTTPAEEALTAWLNGRPPAHIQDIDGGRLLLFILK